MKNNKVSTKAHNQAVKRNCRRFPEDFLFKLTAQEVKELNRSQIVTGSQRHRDPRFKPFAFTEIGFHVKEDTVTYRIKGAGSGGTK